MRCGGLLHAEQLFLQLCLGSGARSVTTDTIRYSTRITTYQFII